MPRVCESVGSGQYEEINYGRWVAGEYGEVSFGRWVAGRGCAPVAVDVAIIILPDGSQEDELEFLQEAAVSGRFVHPNIVRLLGMVTVTKPVRGRLYYY